MSNLQNLELVRAAIADGIADAQEVGRKALEVAGGDSYPCGFAWTIVHGIKLNSKAGKIFKEFGFRKGYGKDAGIELWNPSGLSVQNVDIKYVAAAACAEVIQAQLGLDSYAGSRWD